MFTRVEVVGKENLPPPPVLLAANHLSHLDPALLLAVLPQPPAIVALADLRYRLAAPLIGLYEPILVRRDEIDRDVLRGVVQALREGENVLIFPEARISRTGALECAREGVGYIALHTGVPVVPIAVTGTEKVSTLTHFKRPPLSVTIAPPITPVLDPTIPKRMQRRAVTEEIMRALARCLPPSYRGYYASAVPE